MRLAGYTRLMAKQSIGAGRRVAVARMRPALRFIALLTAAVVLVTPCAADDATLTRAIVASGELTRNPNPVLLAFLVEDCRGCLPADLQQQAVEQITVSLRERTLIQPMEQVGKLMGEFMGAYNPFTMMREAYTPGNILRGALGAGAAPSPRVQQQIQGVRKTLLDPWVRGLEAADNLRRAGYAESAARFYRSCLASIGSLAAGPLGYEWLQDGCIDGALGLGPQAAGVIFAAIWDQPYPDLGIDWSAFAAQGKAMEPVPAIQAVAAKALGKLVSAGGLTPQQRDGVMDELLSLADTRKLDIVAATGIVQGLALAADPRAQPVLQRLARKGKPEEIRPVAVRALAAAYRDQWAVAALRKDLRKGGIGKAFKKAKSLAPWTHDGSAQMIDQAETDGEDNLKYLAASALLHLGDPAAFDWIGDTLTDRSPPTGRTDHRPDLVRDLVETGSERSRSLLAERVSAGHPDEWLHAWMTIGLYELGDRSRLDELEALIDKTDWDFGRGTVGAWYKRLKPLLWEGATMAMGMPADTQKLVRMVAAFAFAERDRHLARAGERARRTAQYRWQLADALAGVDAPETLPLLARLLSSEDTSVRLSAARALVGQSNPGAAELLAHAVNLDYGEEDGASRNPEIHAALLRTLVTRFPDHPSTEAALAEPRRFMELSVALITLAARGRRTL